MLTKEQEEWISHLSNERKIEILPYNPAIKDIFEVIKKEILDFLPEVNVLHRGSTALGILGQGEIDLYIPVLKKDFDNYLEKLINHFGEPGSLYHCKRARFVKYIDNIKIEIFLINEETNDWKNSVKFENYLRKNKSALEKYEKLKQEANGLSVREYYRRKLEFISDLINIC